MHSINQMGLGVPKANALKSYKLSQIAIAKDLGYGNEIISSIRNAETEIQIDNYMKQGRLAM